ncbi:hypothetical protein [Megasphaera sp.]|uniref:hypothetical protein n=1 Tax=Megasphaera sp. TaxID=2023260 RepID=UPI003522720F
MVSTIHNPFDKTKTNTVAAAFAASAILLSPGMMTMPYSQVYNTVVNQRQTNTSLDFSSIDRLKRDFFMTDAAENFLRYYDLTNVLTTAEKHIRDYFPEEKLMLDIDGEREGKVLLLIQTSLSVDKASDLLDALDEAWIIDHIDELKHIVIDVMFI